MRKQGPELLVEWMHTSEISLRELAKAIGCTHPTIQGWIGRKYTPRQEFRLAMETWTEGKIPCESWATPRELELMNKGGKK